ncbi:hypothetical protein TNCV_484201 [Trichonephila clavipes]|nr:hypothetical protein TNCV_484201 [Trichonephila clavipes]
MDRPSGSISRHRDGFYSRAGQGRSGSINECKLVWGVNKTDHLIGTSAPNDHVYWDEHSRGCYATEFIELLNSNFLHWWKRQPKRISKRKIHCRADIQHSSGFGENTHHHFIDFKTAYDSINKKALIAAMKEFKIPDKLLRLISLTLSETKIVVKVQNDLSDPFEIKKWHSKGRCTGVSSI